jgi:hypothetical protein
MTALGFDSLGTSQLTIASAGPAVQVELAQPFRHKARGIFAAFFPDKVGVPALRALVRNGSYKVGHFDWLALFDSVKAAWQAVAEGDAKEFDDEMKQEFGVDLRADLLAHTATEAGLYLGPIEDPEAAESVTWAFVNRLSDAAKFQQALATMLPKAKPLLQREDSEEIDGITVQRYGLLGYNLHLAVGNGHAVLAGGADGADWLRTMMKGLKQDPATAEAALPAGFPGARLLPAGTNGIGSGEIGSAVAMPTSLWWMALGAFGADLGLDMADDEDPEAGAQRRALLREHQLDVLRTATGFTDNTWRWRLYW